MYLSIHFHQTAIPGYHPEVKSYCVPFKDDNYLKALIERFVELQLMGFIAFTKRFLEKIETFNVNIINHFCSEP